MNVISVPKGLSMSEPRIDSPEQRDRVQKSFDEDCRWKGPLYDDPTDRFAHAVQRRKDYALRMVRSLNLPGKNVLDIGCGSGILLEECMIDGYLCYGIDFSREMIETARTRLARH